MNKQIDIDSEYPFWARFGRWLTPYIFTGPAVFLMLVMLIGPVIVVLAISFTDYSLGETKLSWTGFDTYREMVGDKMFWKSLRNTFVYVGAVVPASILLGLVAALLIESLTRGKAFWRTLYFLPVMATLIAMAIAWETMLNPTVGLVADVLAIFGVDSPFWLTDEKLALPMLIVIALWQAVGFNMVLFMAGLTSIPRDLYDAATMDGVNNAWDRFKLVTWPLLGPVTMFVVVITSIRSFQVFDTVHVLTGGGPNNATYVLVYGIYQEGFEFFRSYYGAGLTVVFMIFIFILTAIKAFMAERKVHYK